MHKLFTLLLPLLAANAYADNDAGPQIAPLCGENSIEGRYVGTIQDRGPVTIYLVCTGAERITATWVMIGHGTSAVALPNVAVDDDQLTMTSFSLAYDDASGLSANHAPGIRLELSLEKLHQGRLEGQYKTTLNRLPLAVHGVRDQKFPYLLNLGQSEPSARGTFRIDQSLAQLGLRGPVYLDVDVINGQDRGALADSGGVYETLFMGMLAKTRGDVFYASSGVGESDGAIMPFIQVRGHLKSANEFELYIFNTLYGMTGPYLASRVLAPETWKPTHLSIDFRR